MTKTKSIILWLVWLAIFPSLMVYLFLHYPTNFTENWFDFISFGIIISAVAFFPFRVGNTTIFFINGVSFAVFLYFGLIAEIILTQIALISLFTKIKLKKHENYRIATNSTMLLLTSVFSAGIYYALGGINGPEALNVDQITPIVGYVVSSILINQFILSIVQSYMHSQPFKMFERSLIVDSFLTLATFPLGLILYNMYVELDTLGIYFVGFPFILLSAVLSIYNRTQLLNEYLHTTSEIGHELTKSLNVKSVLDTFVKEVKRVIPATHVYIFDINNSNQSMSLIRYADKEGLNKNNEIKLFIGEGFSGRIYEQSNSKMLLKKSQIEDLRGHEFTADIQSALGVPILRNDVIVGVLTVASTTSRAFEKHHLMLLEILANFLSVAIENARHYEIERRKSQHDQLTGLYNYRYLIEYIDEYATDLEAKGLTEKLSVIIMDLDSFKKINDTYGHESGNEVLVELARRLERLIGDNGIVARYGGEEFTVVIKGMEHERVVEIAENIRRCIADEPFILYKPIDGIMEVKEINVTASIGVSTYPDYCDSPEEIVRKADRAMYVGAKQQGKNRVSSHV
ncbi:sensor domain-containing diguanylate cyclase [Bacillaceae bacterium W0354]